MKENITKVVCDLRECQKEFVFTDNDDQSRIVALALDGQIFYFCGLRHALKFGVEQLKILAEPRAHKAMLELEDVPQNRQDLSLREA